MLTINFKKWNTITGWLAFLIALTVYTLTLEPTVSFWDAGEYIATSAKLEVGHPPGAPLFQMLGAFAAMFATAPDKIAAMVNWVSALSSAFAVLFMFWSATNILMKVVKIGTEKLSNNTVIAVLGSCLIGALTFTFSDTFWFSAVETEVYAMATFMLALLLWLGLRWIDAKDEPRGNKWLLLIALVVGMSFGVHFMALLAIPSIGYLYFFKKYPKVTVKNFIIANIVVVAVLLVVFGFLLPYTMIFFGKSEIFFVNSIGLPFNSGTIIAFVLLVSLFVFGLKYTREKQKQFANTVILSVLFIFIGFSCWLMLPIRANTQIPINENKPSDTAELLDYYNRKQYGDRSLFYDTFFTIKYGSALDPSQPYKDGKVDYERDYATGKYSVINDGKNAEPNYSNRFKGFLPRLWEPDMAANYMSFTKPVDFKTLNNSLHTCVEEIIDNSRYMISFKNNIQYNVLQKKLFDLNIKEEITLTSKELDLIDFLIKNSNRIVSSEELKSNLWEDYFEATDSALKNLLNKVRKKIGKESITNISGVGYKLSF